jgi:phosphopentomutase
VRALLVVLDSVGIGSAPDAAKYGNEGANTLGHILQRIPELELPNLYSLGLAELVAGGADPDQRPRLQHECARFGKMQERSAGKDTTTGHWEIAGAILEKPFALYERFPDELVSAIERRADVHFIGNYARSGTTILEELGPEHCRTGKPILYTSADSVLQIAAHEDVISTERLYEVCRIARCEADQFQIGRVIARPFGGTPGKFIRTSRRHDFSMLPPRTILDALHEQNIPVIGVGKISDIFAGKGIDSSYPTASNREGMERIAALWSSKCDGLIFVNLVDFDMLYGHRRDVSGYGRALEEFDRWLGNFAPTVESRDLVIITADHGNDPTYRGTDHTREEVPLFVLHGKKSGYLGTRKTFADVAASLAEFFNLPNPWPTGSSFL